MTWMPLAIAGAAVSVALAAWGCPVVVRVLASARAIGSFDGMHFEDPGPASPPQATQPGNQTIPASAGLRAHHSLQTGST